MEGRLVDVEDMVGYFNKVVDELVDVCLNKFKFTQQGSKYVT
jgi:hypothetical protein